jgi:uncharacterized protein
MAVFYRQFRWRFRQMLRKVLSSHHSAHQVAAGVALGTLVGFTPLLGFQLIISGLLATIFGFSRIAAMAMVYLSNPVTAIPLYLSCYLLGARLLSIFGIEEVDRERIRQFFKAPDSWWSWEAITAKVTEATQLGWEVMIPLWLGCLVAGIIFAVIMYYVSLRFVTAQRVLRAKRMARRAKTRLERIRDEQERKGDAHPDSDEADEVDL